MLKENVSYIWWFLVVAGYIIAAGWTLKSYGLSQYTFSVIALAQTVFILIQVQSGVAFDQWLKTSIIKREDPGAFKNRILLQVLIVAFAWLLSIGSIFGNWV